MYDEIISLIDFAIIDGEITEEKRKYVKARGKEMGFDEGDIDIIIDSKISHKSKSQKHDLNLNFDIFSARKSNFLPYIFAISAIVFTFFDWIGYNYHSSFNYGGYNSSIGGSVSISQWLWAGLAYWTILFFLAGIILHSMKNNLYWITGILPVIGSIAFYSHISPLNTSVDLGEFGSASYEYHLKYGYFLYLISALLFILSPVINKYIIPYKHKDLQGFQTLKV